MSRTYTKEHIVCVLEVTSMSTTTNKAIAKVATPAIDQEG